MLRLNKEVYAIVDQNGNLEYDYDGPMIQEANGPVKEWLKESVEYLNGSFNKNLRIVKVKLVEVI